MITDVKVILRTDDSRNIEIGKVNVEGLEYRYEMEDEGCLIVESIEDDPHLSAFLISKSLVDYNTWYYLYEIYRGIDMQKSSEYYFVKIPKLTDKKEFLHQVYVGERLNVEPFNRPDAFLEFANICASY